MPFTRITVGPERMGGKPCIRSLRVTVSMVLGQLATGRTTEQLLADDPYLEAEDVQARASTPPRSSTSERSTWRNPA